MTLGDRLKSLRNERGISQGEMERRTGLLRSYISRVENGHTLPSVDTLVKMARALEVPLYRLFYDGEQPPTLSSLSALRTTSREDWGNSGKWSAFFRRAHSLVARRKDADRKLLLLVAHHLIRRHKA
jgi:transcriptional regulator with XRE-family HTH domain